MYKSYKYRIYPNKEQSELLNKHFGCLRNAGAGCSGELVEMSSVDESMKQEKVITFNKYFRG